MKRTRMLAAAGIVATLASGAIAYKTLFQHTAYTITRVIDGDTFETAEKQRIRINGIQAPESGLCGSKEAALALTKRIEGKRVYIKVLYLDVYRRQIANVYLSNGSLLASVLAREGSVYVRQNSPGDQALLAAGDEARANKRGIYGEPCTQTENEENARCVIKANNPGTTGRKIYHLPGCKSYPITQVQLYMGDQWFCTEKEAIRAGYTKAESCP